MCYCCLTSQSKRHLRTLMWRNSLMIRRSKGTLCCFIVGPLLLMCLSLILSRQLKGTTQKITTMDPYVVTSSSFSDDGAQLFDGADTGLKTQQDFEDCFFSTAFSIGLVVDSKFGEEAADDLRAIYSEINDALIKTQKANGHDATGMKKQEFKSLSELDDFVMVSDYAIDGICFALAWDQYDKSNPDEPEYSLEILTKLEQSKMQNPNYPQDKYFTQLHDRNQLDAMNSTDFLQIMALATKRIVDQNTETDSGDFSVMYTQMNTREYEEINDYDTSGPIYGVFFEIMILISTLLLNANAEKGEENFWKMQKRLGVHRFVLVTRDLSVTTIYGTISTLAYTIVLWLVAYHNTLSFGVFYLFVFLCQVQSILRINLLRNVLPRKSGPIIQLFYMVYQISMAQSFIQKIPSVQTLTLGCCFSPMMQLVSVLDFAFVSQPFDRVLTFNDFSLQIFPDITMMRILIISLCSVAFWVLLTLYLWPLYIETNPDNPARWYYVFQPSFWCKSCSSQQDEVQNKKVDDLEDQGENEKFLKDRDANLRESQIKHLESSNLQAAEKELVRQGRLEMPAFSSLDAGDARIEISNLTKIYKEKTVVNDLSLTVYENEILVILGHNGAGKSTTLNMLTGLARPTSGQATVFNITERPIDLFADYPDVVDLIGICPQQDVLFQSMTVRENLLFYCKLKGVQDTDRVVADSLEKFNLLEKSEIFTRDISADQKRKLQLAIALIGDSKIVLLDEPTYQMDSIGRGETWEMIKQLKTGKIIILTTTNMDEAEYLADRVAILSRGSLEVCGSTSFLKLKLGQYFYLEVKSIATPPAPNQALIDHLEQFNQRFRGDRASSSDLSSRNSSKIEEESKQGQSQMLLSVDSNMAMDYEPIYAELGQSGQVIYKLGNYNARHFKEIFTPIDSEKERFDISSYTIRNMTLQQVFLEIGQRDIQNEIKEETETGTVEDVLLENLPPMSQPGFCVRFKALLVSQVQTMKTGIPFMLFLTFIGLVLVLGCVYIPLKTASFRAVDYSNLESIYGENQMNLRYNPNYYNSDPNEIVQSIIDENSSLKGLPDDSWTPSTVTGNATAYFQNLGDSIKHESNEEASIWVNAGQDKDSQKWKIDATVYVNSTSFGLAPTFGNLLLQSIARQMTDKSKLKLSFKYTVWKESITQYMTVNPKYAWAIFTTGQITTFQLETLLVGYVLIEKLVGVTDWLMMKGATRQSFILARAVVVFAILLVYTMIFKMSNWFYTVNTHGWQLLGLFYAVSETLYVSFITSLIMISPKWYGLYGLLTAIVTFMPGAKKTGFDLATQPGIGGLHVPITVQFFSPSAQYVFILFLSQFRQTQYALQNQEHSYHKVEDITSFKEALSIFSQYGGEYPFTFMKIQILMWGSLLFISLCCCKDRRIKVEKESLEPLQDQFQVAKSVKAEKERVEASLDGYSQAEQDIVIVHNLVKRYKSQAKTEKAKTGEESRQTQVMEGEDEIQAEGVSNQEKTKYDTAIKGITFGVKRGELLSLVGVNGAGKSSTFKCMVAYQSLSGGTIKLDGADVKKFYHNPTALHGVLGYCPQTNDLYDDLTVKQQVTLVSKLVGIEKASLQNYVTSIIARFGLNQYADTQTRFVSDGNQRKLALALAVIGQPKIIFIDEATTGVDPASRRTIMRAIQHEGKNSAVIMTTQSMEEADAISSKIAIQVDGFIRSYGTPEQIKRADGQECYLFDFNIDLNGLLSHFEISAEERQVRDQDLIQLKLREWSAKAKQEFGSYNRFSFENEFKQFGLLDRFVLALEQGKAVDLHSMLSELLMQEAMGTIKTRIEELGLQAFIKSFNGSHFTIEVDQCKHSFGEMYAFLESIKVQCFIKEYSCKLSSLEEIFNAHASEQQFIELNKRIERHRTNTMGSLHL